MFIWTSLLYTLPLVVALVIAGALVGRRVNPAARLLLWLGIVFICLAQAATLATPMLVASRDLMWLYQVVNVGLFVLRVAGTVLLIAAAGRAASGRPAGGYPPQSPVGQYGYPPPPAGQSGHPQYGQPGHWGGGPQH
ncbi:MAG: hypothetical protein GYA85_06795 [Propionibacterium sp.]|nr:hypothetical protein [Propionibacterium sp.]